MSSAYVRTQVKQFLDDNSAENFIDLTSAFQEINELLADSNVMPDSPWVGIQFQGDTEFPIGLAANNEVGKYRETGMIYLHIVDVARIGVGDSLLTRGEVLRDLLRGRRIGDIFIESVSPMNFEAGATLEFEGGYISGSFMIGYQRDLDL